MNFLKLVGLSVFALALGSINNDAFSQKTKKLKSKGFYKVPRSEYIMMDNGKIYPIEDYGLDYDYTVEDWAIGSNYILPEMLETEEYILKITPGDSFPMKSLAATELGLREVDRTTLNNTKRYGKYFSLQDTCITLKLANGTKSFYYPTFMDSLTPVLALLQDYEIKSRWHYFEGYVKSLDAYLINWIDNMSYYESDEGYILVSAKDGSEIPFGAMNFYESPIYEQPIISKDNKQVLFVKNSGLKIYSNDNGHFTEKINVSFFDDDSMFNGYIIDVIWESENSFLMRVNSMENDYFDHYKRVTITKK